VQNLLRVFPASSSPPAQKRSRPGLNGSVHRPQTPGSFRIIFPSPQQCRIWKKKYPRPVTGFLPPPNRRPMGQSLIQIFLKSHQQRRGRPSVKWRPLVLHLQKSAFRRAPLRKIAFPPTVAGMTVNRENFTGSAGPKLVRSSPPLFFHNTFLVFTQTSVPGAARNPASASKAFCMSEIVAVSMAATFKSHSSLPRACCPGGRAAGSHVLLWAGCGTKEALSGRTPAQEKYRFGLPGRTAMPTLDGPFSKHSNSVRLGGFDGRREIPQCPLS